MNMAEPNPQLEELTSSRWIDQLVDGELTETQRAEVLRALEAHPEGWRRCALAFLEHREFAAWIPEAAADTVRLAPQHGLDTRSGSNWTHLLAMAATAFFAFVIGVRSTDWLDSTVQPPTEQASSLVDSSDASHFVAHSDDAVLPLNHFLDQESSFPLEAIQALEASGHRVQTHRGLVPYVNVDGSRVFVPYEELEIVPVGRMTH